MRMRRGARPLRWRAGQRPPPSEPPGLPRIRKLVSRGTSSSYRMSYRTSQTRGAVDISADRHNSWVVAEPGVVMTATTAGATHSVTGRGRSPAHLPSKLSSSTIARARGGVAQQRIRAPALSGARTASNNNGRARRILLLGADHPHRRGEQDPVMRPRRPRWSSSRRRPSRRALGVPVAMARKWSSSVRRGCRLPRAAPGSSP